MVDAVDATEMGDTVIDGHIQVQFLMCLPGNEAMPTSNIPPSTILLGEERSFHDPTVESLRRVGERFYLQDFNIFEMTETHHLVANVRMDGESNLLKSLILFLSNDSRETAA